MNNTYKNPLIQVNPHIYRNIFFVFRI